LNELVTNAVKHGIKDHARQGVRISLTDQDGGLALSVEDDGEVDRFLEEGTCDWGEVSGGGDGHGSDAESHPGEHALSRDVE